MDKIPYQKVNLVGNLVLLKKNTYVHGGKLCCEGFSFYQELCNGKNMSVIAAHNRCCKKQIYNRIA